MILRILFGFLALATAGDWKTEQQTFADYKAKKATCTTATDFEALATHPHCQRDGNEWVSLWALQTAAWRHHKEGDRRNAERLAAHVAKHPASLPTQRARAMTILAHWQTTDRNWSEAARLYQEAEDLDPECSATDGLGKLREAKRIGG